MHEPMMQGSSSTKRASAQGIFPEDGCTKTHLLLQIHPGADRGLYMTGTRLDPFHEVHGGLVQYCNGVLSSGTFSICMAEERAGSRSLFEIPVFSEPSGGCTQRGP